MDHMMPKMDGIETTQKIREFGYKDPIVAFTANALAGNDEMFKGHGFNDFISKPIDIRLLDSILNKFIRNKYDKNEIKYQTQVITETLTPKVSSKILLVFRKEAARAVVTLKKKKKNGDIKLFTITVHSMKSALANVGEKTLSMAASELENAGQKGDMDFIHSNAQSFINSLEEFINTIHLPLEISDEENKKITEDKDYLSEQLKIIISACEEYDDTKAYSAFDNLNNKAWKKETKAALEEIRNKLFLHSDFEEASEKAKKMLGF
jgi:CheY-like chemotaxis protein